MIEHEKKISKSINLNIIGNPSNPKIHFTDPDGIYNQTELLTLMTFGSTTLN